MIVANSGIITSSLHHHIVIGLVASSSSEASLLPCHRSAPPGLCGTGKQELRRGRRQNEGGPGYHGNRHCCHVTGIVAIPESH